MNVRIKLYSLPGCPQCQATKRRLESRGIEYIDYDLATDPWAVQEAEQLGCHTAPLVVTDTAHWVGYRPDLIDQL